MVDVNIAGEEHYPKRHLFSELDAYHPLCSDPLYEDLATCYIKLDHKPFFVVDASHQTKKSYCQHRENWTYLGRDYD